jgi:hypothetical protein
MTQAPKVSGPSNSQRTPEWGLENDTRSWWAQRPPSTGRRRVTDTKRRDGMFASPFRSPPSGRVPTGQCSRAQ